MAVNDKVSNRMTQADYGQSATSKANQTVFTPGKTNARADDENWPKDFEPAVAGISGALYYDRVHLIGRGVINDQTQDIPDPEKKSFAPEDVKQMMFHGGRTGGDFLKA